MPSTKPIALVSMPTLSGRFPSFQLGLLKPFLEKHGFERIESGNLVATYARSKFEDTRQKAIKFGAQGTTVKAFKSTNVHKEETP